MTCYAFLVTYHPSHVACCVSRAARYAFNAYSDFQKFTRRNRFDDLYSYDEPDGIVCRVPAGIYFYVFNDNIYWTCRPPGPLRMSNVYCLMNNE